MQAIFLKLIEQLNGAVLILLLVLIIAFWVVYKLSHVVTLFGSFKDERKEIKDDIRQIKTDTSKIEATVNVLYQRYLSTVQSSSPLSLTTKGRDISSAIKMEGKIANHWESIKAKLDSKAPSNPYDIQSVSMEVARDCFDALFSEIEKNEIKLHAYETGTNLLEIFPIIGIIVRNKYLKEKGFSVEEIDQHAPKSD